LRCDGSSSENPVIFLPLLFFLSGDRLSIEGPLPILGGETDGGYEMPAFEEIGKEKQRIADRLARVEAERAKLAEQLNELEIAERVLGRFGKTESGMRRRRGRPAKTAPSAASGAPRARRARAAVSRAGTSLSDAALKTVHAHAQGIAAADVLSYLASQFGMKVRPNHLGIALQRHRRAGRLEQRGALWYPPPQTSEAAPA
jgi:hypothetical protein